MHGAPGAAVFYVFFAFAKFLGQQFPCILCVRGTRGAAVSIHLLCARSLHGSSFYAPLLVHSPLGSSFYTFLCAQSYAFLGVQNLGQQPLLGGLLLWAVAVARGTAALGHFLPSPLRH